LCSELGLAVEGEDVPRLHMGLHLDQVVPSAALRTAGCCPPGRHAAPPADSQIPGQREIPRASIPRSRAVLLGALAEDEGVRFVEAGPILRLHGAFSQRSHGVRA
jgi:hypothetical protein